MLASSFRSVSKRGLLVERLLDVLDAALDDVLELPPGCNDVGLLAHFEAVADLHLLLVGQAVVERLLTASDTGAELKLKSLAGLVDSGEQTVKIVLGVSG